MAMTPSEQGLSLSALAVEFGTDRRTMANALRDVTPVGRGSGGAKLYRLSDAAKALGLGRRQKAPEDPAYAEARRRRAKATAELAEIELAQKRGELVPIKMVIDVVTKQFSGVRARLLALPGKLAPRVAEVTDPREALRIIDAVVNEALVELSDPKNLLDGAPAK